MSGVCAAYQSCRRPPQQWYSSTVFASPIAERMAWNSFVKHLAAALYGMRTVDVNGSKTVLHAHTGGGVAVDCGFHGDIILREFVAGLGVVAVCVQRFKIHLNAELLELRLDKLRIANAGFPCPHCR